MVSPDYGGAPMSGLPAGYHCMSCKEGDVYIPPESPQQGATRVVNRLAQATSPYLLQHKDNPVDWWPWCDEAFADARRREVPVLLSVGYAACHWCHVMAHESFEDEQT